MYKYELHFQLEIIQFFVLFTEELKTSKKMMKTIAFLVIVASAYASVIVSCLLKLNYIHRYNSFDFLNLYFHILYL